MIKLPPGIEYTDVGALAYLMGLGEETGDLEVAVDTWDLNGPLPEFPDPDWIQEALKVTEDLIHSIEDGGQTIVHDATDAEDLFLFYSALVDGHYAVTKALPSIQSVEDSAIEFDDTLDRLVGTNVYVPKRPDMSSQPCVIS